MQDRDQNLNRDQVVVPGSGLRSRSSQRLGSLSILATAPRKVSQETRAPDLGVGLHPARASGRSEPDRQVVLNLHYPKPYFESCKFSRKPVKDPLHPGRGRRGRMDPGTDVARAEERFLYLVIRNKSKSCPLSRIQCGGAVVVGGTGRD
jgi:hypothetical protein